MMIARWRIDARFGHKSEVIRLLKSWHDDFGSKIGWVGDRMRMVTGSVGIAESAIVSEVQVADLAELNAAFEKLGTLDGHDEWSKQMEPHVVSGTNAWEIWRVV